MNAFDVTVSVTLKVETTTAPLAACLAVAAVTSCLEGTAANVWDCRGVKDCGVVSTASDVVEPAAQQPHVGLR